MLHARAAEEKSVLRERPVTFGERSVTSNTSCSKILQNLVREKASQVHAHGPPVFGSGCRNWIQNGCREILEGAKQGAKCLGHKLRTKVLVVSTRLLKKKTVLKNGDMQWVLLFCRHNKHLLVCAWIRRKNLDLRLNRNTRTMLQELAGEGLAGDQLQVIMPAFVRLKQQLTLEQVFEAPSFGAAGTQLQFMDLELFHRLFQKCSRQAQSPALKKKLKLIATFLDHSKLSDAAKADLFKVTHASKDCTVPSREIK